MTAKRGGKQTRTMSQWTSLKVVCLLVFLHTTCTTVVRPETRRPHLSTTEQHHDHHYSHHSRAHVNRSDPSFRYMYELYQLMVRQEKNCCLPVKGDHEKAETIRSIPGMQGGVFPNLYLTFNISSLEDSENITLVQVAVETRVRHHSSCHVHLEDTSHRPSTRPACQHKPFNISHLDVFNFTSSLISHLTSHAGRDHQFTVFLNSSGHMHVHNTFLVVFQDIDADQLLNQHCPPCPPGHGSVSDNEMHHAGLTRRQKRDAGGPDAATEGWAEEHEGLRRGTRGGASHFLPWDSSSSALQQGSGNAPAYGNTNRWVALITAAVDFVKGVGRMFREALGEAAATLQKTKSLDSSKGDHVTNDVDAELLREGGEAPEARSPPLFVSPLSARERVQLLHERRRRHAEVDASATYERPGSVCQVTDLILHPATDLGIQDVLLPETFNINLCSGRCSKILPLTSNNATHYSFLTSLFTFLHPQLAAQRDPPIPRPRCIPSAFGPMSVYMVRDAFIRVERWWSAIVLDCQCV